MVVEHAEAVLLGISVDVIVTQRCRFSVKGIPVFWMMFLVPLER